MDIKQMLQEVKHSKKLTKNKIVVGVLSSEIVSFLEDKNVAIHTKEIYLTSKGLSHLSRDSKRKRGAGLSKEDILKIPKILKEPSYVYFDSKKDKLNLLYITDKEDRYIKIVVDTDSYDKKFRDITLIKTAGIIDKNNINDKNYIKVEKRVGGR